MNYRKPAFWVILIALVVGILAAVCFLTNPKSEEEDTSGYELIGSVTSQNGYTILNQEHTKINLVIEKEKLPEDCFTLKGHTFEAKEVIPYQTFADNVLYLKHVGIDEERSEYLRFNFSFQTDALEEGNLLLPYHMDDAGNGFVCNVEVNRGEVWDNQKTYENAAYFAPNIMGEGFCVLVKKSVCESAGHHIAFMLNDMNRLTYEVREEISPVTISLENVRPTGATILFHQDQDLISGSLICDYAYFLQQLTDGQWIDLPKLAEIPFPDQTYDIALLHHNGVNWEQMYGRLPVGSYRLGKVIPITSGDEPEYTTVYAEFTIDHVYTWFDDYSNNREEQYPKDNLVELFGMAGGSLSYHSDENTVYLIDAEGRNPIISCELRIRNIFLTDITGDSVAEVCATVQMKDGMHVQVYDATKKKLYQLPNGENWDCILTKKADRLCVRKQDDNGINIEYGQLSLDAEEGLQIHELDPEVLALSKNIVCVDVMNGKQVCLSSFSQIEQARSLLRDLEHQVHPATREEAETARKDPFDYCTITVNYELGEKQIVFSENFDFVWEYGSAETYRLSAPEPVRQLVGSVTNGIRMKETSGEPFATADAPWDWFAGVNMDAISTAQIYVCLDVTSTGNSTRVSGTNGIMPADSLQKLVNVLNQIPRDAFAADRMLTGQSAGYFRNTQQEVNCAVIMIDTVNHIAVMIRTSKGNVELLLTSELDKVLNDDHRYLEPTQIWTVRDQNLLSLLKDFCEDPPVITYFVGAEYQWQDPVTLTMDGFHMDLRLIEGWEYEYVTNAAGSGIRCRPAAVAEGWIYFSFWPEGYLAEEADRYLAEGYRNGFPSNISYPASVKSNNGVDTRHAVWSYEAVITDIGDFAIINDGADSWFLEYEDQIQDIISYVDFTVE